MTKQLRDKIALAQAEGATHFHGVGECTRPGDVPMIFMAKKNKNGEWIYKHLSAFGTQYSPCWFRNLEGAEDDLTPIEVGLERLDRLDERRRLERIERLAEEKGQMMLL